VNHHKYGGVCARTLRLGFHMEPLYGCDGVRDFSIVNMWAIRKRQIILAFPGVGPPYIICSPQTHLSTVSITTPSHPHTYIIRNRNPI